ncbi:MAG TPA: DUF4118 domain-containing protein [Ktedonobacteraceae bacterium]|nr:DUF4118 domain-containing protein [Ktedonobacteraceae bacterium]
MKKHPLSAVERSQQQIQRPLAHQAKHTRSWWRSSLVGYALSLGFVAGAFLTAQLETLIDVDGYFIGILFVVGTFLVGWVWGTGPAVLTMLIGFLATDYLVIPPHGCFLLRSLACSCRSPAICGDSTVRPVADCTAKNI